VIVLAPEVYLPLRAVGARFHDAVEGLTAADEVFAVLAATPATGPGERRPAPDPARVVLRCEGVGVAGRGGMVLDGVDLVVRPGEAVGLRGPSGVGKSTLLDVVLGLRRPDRGRVTVGGVDLAGLEPAAWHERVAWVPQRPVLLAGTVAENIRLGAPGADDAAVRRAARAARVDVALATPVGEGGAGLSTGQRRRVALARALLLERPLLVLDEPTEGVDAATEAAVLRALPSALHGRSAVIVSHRPAVLAVCDRVVELGSDGRTGEGRPSPLYSSEGALRSVGDDDPGSGEGRPSSIYPSEGALRSVGDDDPGSGEGRPSSIYPSEGALRSRTIGSPGAWRWLLSAARPRLPRLALAVALGAGAGGCVVALTATSAWLISAAALRPPVLTLMVAIVAVRAFGLGKGVLRYLERLVSHDAALRLGADLRVRVWTALVRQGPAVTARQRRGDLLVRLTADVDAQQDVLVGGLVPAAAAGVVGFGAVVLFAVLLPAAAPVLAGGLLVAGVLAPALTAGAGRRAARATAGARAAVAAGTVELFDAAADVLVLGAAPARRRRLGVLDAELARLRTRQAGAAGLGAAAGVLGVGLATVGCAALGVLALGAGTLVPTALAVLALTPLATAEVVAALPDAATRLVEAVPAARRLAELESRPAPVTDPVPAAPVPADPGVDVDDLAVRWPGADRDAVTAVSFALARGERVVLAGPSGAGKSSVLATVLRTLAPARGAVRLDGRDTAMMAGDEVRARIGWTGSDAHLFDSSLRENLRLARPDAPDADLLGALRRARLGAWYAGLPDGLDTLLGEHGGPVSGGERQRLAVARVLLADRPLLALDEPTAHLDAETATALAAEIDQLSQGRTAVVVTHRPAEFPGMPVVVVGDGPAARRGVDVGPGHPRRAM
jgi:ATP-binding cassette, subfamily C, bacterial CydCD